MGDTAVREQKIKCKMCSRGCTLRLSAKKDGTFQVSGNHCKKGECYGMACCEDCFSPCKSCTKACDCLPPGEHAVVDASWEMDRKKAQKRAKKRAKELLKQRKAMQKDGKHGKKAKGKKKKGKKAKKKEK